MGYFPKSFISLEVILLSLHVNSASGLFADSVACVLSDAVHHFGLTLRRKNRIKRI
jgi:hypothetical protein